MRTREQIQDSIKKNRITYREIAELTGLGIGTIARIANCEGDPLHSSAEKVDDAINQILSARQAAAQPS